MAMDIQQTRTLRIVADGDSSGYVAARNAMAAADKAASSAAKAVEVAVTSSAQKINQSGDVVGQLQRKYVDGAKQAQSFSTEIAKLGRALESGRATTADAVEILEAMSTKLGLTANAAQVAATGNIALSRAVEQVNARLAAQRSGVDALTASYQRMAAEARAAQAADQAQGNINRQLGVRTVSSGSAAASASVFSSTLDRQDEISRLRAQQNGQNFASDLNRRLGLSGGGSNSARDSAAVFEDSARQADQLAQKASALRAALDPVAASQARLNDELAEYQKLADASLITTKEMSDAEAIARARHDEVTKSFANGGRSAGLQRFQVQDIAYQAQDSITQAFGGSSPTTIGLQQGPQLAMAFAGQSGKEALSTLGAGLTSLISPVNLLSIGFVTLGAAGIQAFEKIKGSVKPLADSLQAEEDALKRIAAAYGGVAEQAAKAGSESKRLVDAIGARSNAALTLSTNVAAGDFFSNKDVGSARSAGRFGQARSGFVAATPAFQQPIEDLQKSFKAGKADFDAFYEAITRKVELDPSLSKAGNTIISLTETFKRAYDAMVEFQRIRDALFNDQGPGRRLLSQGTTNQKDMGDYALFESQQKIALARSQQSFDAQVAGVNARSPGERADAARKAAAAQYNNDETPAQRNQRINQAGQLAEIQAQKALTDAQRDRELSLQKTLSDQQMEINLIGKTGGEAAKLRQEYQLTEQLRQEAAKNGTDVDEKEIALIKQKSDELGKLTDQYNKAKLTNDLSFERDQIFRSPQDQQIASRLQSAGRPIDLQSNEANLIRQNLQASAIKDSVTGFMTDFRQQIVSNGGKVGEAFGSALKNAALNALTKIGDDAANVLGNLIVKMLTGTSSGATSASSIASSSGGLLGAIFGGNSGAAASSAVRQAANSNIAGAVTGDSLSLYRSAIGKIESGNNYGSLGPLTASGDRAYGAYQVMGANIPSWTKGALGESLTPNQFLANPSAQDAVFNKYFGSSVSKYGNPQDAASVWFTGRPLAQGANASDILGTTGTQYVDKFNDALGKMTDSTKQATAGLGQLGSGLGQVGQSLSTGAGAFPAAPSKGLGGWLGSLFGGGLSSYGQSIMSSSAQFSHAWSLGGIGLYANGTDFSPGGVAMVGENGRELVNLPRGSQVIPNHKTEAMMRGAANANDSSASSAGPGELHVHIDGANGDDHVRKLVQQGVRDGLFNYNEGMRRQGVGTLNARFNSQKG